MREQGRRTRKASRRQADRGEGPRGDEVPIREGAAGRVRVRAGRGSWHAAAFACLGLEGAKGPEESRGERHSGNGSHRGGTGARGKGVEVLGNSACPRKGPWAQNPRVCGLTMEQVANQLRSPERRRASSRGTLFFFGGAPYFFIRFPISKVAQPKFPLTKKKRVKKHGVYFR